MYHPPVVAATVSVLFTGRQALRKLIEQPLLAFVLGSTRLIQIALHQLAQAFHPRVTLLPGRPGLVEILAVPVEALLLLANGGFQLTEEALVVHQPLSGNPFAAFAEPLLLIVSSVAFKLAQLCFGLGQQTLHVRHFPGSLAFVALGHFDHRRQTRSAAICHLSGLRLRTEHLRQLRAALVQRHTLTEALAQVAGHDRLAGNGQIGIGIAPRHIGTDADQVATLLVA